MPGKDKGHSRQSSVASDGTSQPQSPSVAVDEGLEDETLLAGLRSLYEDFKVRFCYLFSRDALFECCTATAWTARGHCHLVGPSNAE